MPERSVDKILESMLVKNRPKNVARLMWNPVFSGLWLLPRRDRDLINNTGAML